MTTQIRRVMVAVSGLLLALLALWLLREHGPQAGWLPGCVFHRLTGWHCAGCGMTRATAALTHGDVAAAFRLNAVGMVLLPLALAGMGIELIGWVRGRPLPFRLNPGVWGGWALVVLIAAFWLLRNLPWWPFTLLAPH